MDKPKHGRTIAIRLSHQLNADIQRLADRESNPPAAVARRLIRRGLEVEARHERERETVRGDREPVAS
jgi:hypothetical protein